MKRPPLDPELIRDRLAVEQGKRYWRSLEELADDPAVREMVEREFPDSASQWTDPVSRRRFLALMGASLGLAGLVGCTRPTGTIMPYVKQPEHLTPGIPLHFATAMTQGGFATGLVVESHEGRPTKIEGNRNHPASLGATTVQQQAAILGLYDPDRSQSVMFRDQPRSWMSLLEILRQRLQSSNKGKGVAVLCETIGSPTLEAQRKAFQQAFPELRWFTYEPINRDQVVAAATLAFGKPLHSYYRLTNADVIVSFDADFLAQGPGCLAYTRQFTARRKEGGKGVGMNRLYVVETDVSVTGSRADHRLAVKPSEVEKLTRALAALLKIDGVAMPTLDDKQRRWIEAVARDLTQVNQAPRPAGSTAVLVGELQPAKVQALVHAINHRLGNFGQTVLFTEPLPIAQPNQRQSLEALTTALAKNELDTLLILGGNPVYNAPADLPLGERLANKLKESKTWLAVRVGEHYDETSRACHWHVPRTHFLEEWSDGLAYDGTACIVQPLIAPLYGGKSFHELLALLTPIGPEGQSYDSRSVEEIIRAYWEQSHPKDAKESFERFWQRALHDGVVRGSTPPTLVPTLLDGFTSKPEMLPSVSPESDGLEIVFAPDYATYDGRFANNGWLQEWPKPLTRLSWDNAVIMGPETAKQLGLSTRVDQWKGGEHGSTIADTISLTAPPRYSLRGVPIWIQPGHAEGALTVHLGYGRERVGRVGTKVGFNANKIRPTSAWFLTGVKVSKLNQTHELACQQAHHSMEGRDIVRSGKVNEYKPPKKHALPTLFDGKDHPYDGYKWAMAVDLSACTGCGACVVACQAENNIPIVGKDQVQRAREMHWLRIDRYYETPLEDNNADPYYHFQPVMCQHCENAPCEVVCPVEATVHGDEGTNDMVYNRCVGTRYCANNCPYKVRRFNFLEYADFKTPSLKLQYNPEVTVRTRGVMEKCTFCIQRISHARIEASRGALEGDPERKDPHGRRVQGKELPYIPDESLYTACEAACPAEALVFGDLNDVARKVGTKGHPGSEVARLRESELSYDLLGELGVRPRVFYLASLRNPNPELEGA